MDQAADNALAGESRTAFALASIEAMGLAIPADQLIRALPWPAELTTVPRRQGAVAGVFQHLGEVLPLVDLRTWLHSQAWSSSPLSQVLILKEGARRVALAVSQVGALVWAQSSQIHRVHHGQEDGEFFHSVLVSDSDAGTANVLDVEALLNHVAVWSLQSGAHPIPDTLPGEPVAQSGLTGMQCVVQLANTLFAIAATEVGEVLAMPRVQWLGIPGTRVFGLIEWRGRHVPVVDVLGALNLPGDGGLGNPLLLVVQAIGRCLAFPVSQTVSVERFHDHNVQKLAPASDVPLAPFASVLLTSGSRAQCLRAKDLLDCWTISGISEVRASSEPQSKLKSSRESVSAVALAVFEAGQQWATGLDQIEEILHFPDHHVPLQTAQRNVLGTFDWRKQAIPLLDLRADLGQTTLAPDTSSRVIVVRARQQLAGVVVDKMLGLIPANLGTLSPLAIGRGVTIQMVTTGSGADQRSYRLMNFAELAYFTTQSPDAQAVDL